MQNNSLTETLTILHDIVVDRVRSHVERKPLSFRKLEENTRTRLPANALHLPDSLSIEERIIMLIALAPHIIPGFFEGCIAEIVPQGGEFVEFGGIKGQQHRGMLPTGETALFILGGTDVDERFRIQQMFAEDQNLAISGLLNLEPVRDGEPAMSGRLIADIDWLEKLLMGRDAAPVFSSEFPARRLLTPMHWDDLVLHPQTMEQVDEIMLWMRHREVVSSDPVLARKVKRGYRVLFYGQAGTGKTLTASLLGKIFHLPVYRIDLSQVVSKYIGETEKHLEWIFQRAARKQWILFFDEADALFGKRTNVQSAHDKYANQEVAYLLQRIEEYEGLLILASNFKSNIDEAFLRRFNNIIHFPMPGPVERQKLWQSTFPQSLRLEASIDSVQLAQQYEITGAGIVNVIHYATLKAFGYHEGVLRLQDIIDGIRREFVKEEKGF